MLGCHTVKVWLKNSRATRKVGDRLGVGQNTETGCGGERPTGLYPPQPVSHNYLPMKMEQSVPKRRHINFRRRGITQKKVYNIQNTAKV